MIEDLSHIDRIIRDVHIPDFTLPDPAGSLPDQVQSHLVGIFGEPGIIDAARRLILGVDMDPEQVAKFFHHHKLAHDLLRIGATDRLRHSLKRKPVTEYLPAAQDLGPAVDVQNSFLLLDEAYSRSGHIIVNRLTVSIFQDHLNLVKMRVSDRPEVRGIHPEVNSDRVVNPGAKFNFL